MDLVDCRGTHGLPCTFGRKGALFLFPETHFSLSCFLVSFSFKFFDLIMKEPMIFIDIPADRIKHEFFIYLFRRAVIETPEIIVFLDIAKMSFCLDGTDLAVQDPFFTLDIGMGFFPEFLPTLVDLHDFIFIGIFFCIVFI